MIDAQQSAALRPARRLRDVAAYQPPALYDAVDLWLDANEGRAPSAEVLGALACLPADDVRRYARPGSLEADISARFGIEVNQVVVTNGGDESIDRLCRAVLDRDRGLVLHTPTFEMIPRSARLADAQIREVRWWDETFPAGAMVHAIDASTGMVAVVSPNNPTGSVIATPDLITIADRAAAVGAVVMVDFAYIEFADADPTLELLQRENVAVVRTFSKAWGMAGLRVGYTLT
ncbi:MAG: aminotransferase class I/II-fold pyridoxal phosphate-dependent enzyme, partial [Planctomycetota bacterium]